MSSVATRLGARSTRTADVLVDWLYQQGVRRVYGIPGGAVAPLFDALVDSPITAVICQHEGMAGYLAAGEARATGRPGVVAVTSGPGILNTITPVAAAFEDEVPLIVIAGEVRTEWAGRGALQDGGPSGLDVRSIFRSVTRFQDDLSQPGRSTDLLGRAWEAALTHPRGPALLRIPVDVSRAAAPSVPEWRSSLLPSEPDVAALERASALLRGAERPAIFAGVGARAASLGPILEGLAYRLRAPVFTDLEAKSLVPETDPMCLGLYGPGQGPQATRYLAEGVDVLLTVGARLDDTTTGGFGDALRPSQALIQLDHDPRRLGRLWPAEISLLGDLRGMCQLLYEATDPLPAATLLARDLAVRRCRASIEPAHCTEGPPFDPRAVVRALHVAWPDATFVTDIGNHMLFTARHLTTDRVGSFQASTGLAGMGSGIGTAMGMAAAGAGPVVGICGDGGLLMVGNELATCARYGIGVVLCVFDDGRLNMVDHGMRYEYGRSESAALPEVSLVDWARSLGAHAVDVASLEDLVPPEGGSDRPVLLRVPVDPAVRMSNPRLQKMSSSG